ncbi:MAG: hypothetical protein WCV67_19620 [Victivallaceae bacterium]|jgi:hypothetical protein
MTNFKRTTAIVSLVITAVTVATLSFAAEPAGCARFSVSGSNSKINLTPGTASSGGSVENISWGSESERKQCLTAEIPLADGWSEFSFSFTPDKDGPVQLDLLGQDKNDADNKKIALYTFYDDITVTGAELKNGNFESFSEENPAGWYFWNQDANHPARIVCDANAHGGKYFAAAWIQGHVVQHIKVTANKAVTLRGFAMPAGAWTEVKTSAAKPNVSDQEKVAAVKPVASTPSATGSAKSGSARFTINGSKSKINLTPGTASAGGSVQNIHWGSAAERKQALIAEIPLTGGWNEFSFSFTTDKNGPVQLDLLGQDKNDADNKKMAIYTFYDDITATGAELQNGDFESFNEENPAVWYFWSPNANHPAQIVCDTNAHGGKYFAAAWLQGAVVQHINVSANQVTIRGFAMPAGAWAGVKTSAVAPNAP